MFHHVHWSCLNGHFQEDEECAYVSVRVCVLYVVCGVGVCVGGGGRIVPHTIMLQWLYLPFHLVDSISGTP